MHRIHDCTPPRLESFGSFARALARPSGRGGAGRLNGWYTRGTLAPYEYDRGCWVVRGGLEHARRAKKAAAAAAAAAGSNNNTISDAMDV